MDLKIKDVADLLNVSETTIRRWLADGKIPAYKINHQYRFNRSEIEHWVLGQKLGVDLGTSPLPEEEEPPAKGGSMQYCLYRALHKGGALYNIPGNSKEEVIQAAVKQITPQLHLDTNIVSELLIDRERLQPTAINHGIAIPHTRDNLLKNRSDSVTIVFPENPIEYGALDGEPVHTLFFLFASDDRRHLHLLAKIAHLSSQPKGREFLASRPSKEALLEFVKEWESTI